MKIKTKACLQYLLALMLVSSGLGVVSGGRGLTKHQWETNL